TPSPFPSSHYSMPGSRALKPLRWSRLRCGSESNDRLLSAMKSMQPGGTASSIASMVALKRTPKFGIVPGDPRPLQRPHEEAQILLHHLAVQGLIGHVRIDTKAAGVGTPQTAEHRHDLEEGRFVQR